MSANFVCEAKVTGNNAISINWFKRSDDNSQIQINVSDARVVITSVFNPSNSKSIFSNFTLSNISVLDAATYLCVADAGSCSEAKSASLAVLMSTTQRPITTSKPESLSITMSTLGMYSQSSSIAGSLVSTLASFPSLLSLPSNQAQTPSSTINVINTQTIHTSVSSIAPTATLSLGTLTTAAIRSSKSLITEFFFSATLTTSTSNILFTINPTIMPISSFIIPTPSSYASLTLSRTTNELPTSTLGTVTIKSVSSLFVFASSILKSASRIVSSPASTLSQSVLQPTQITVFQSHSVSTVSPFLLASPAYSPSQSDAITKNLITTKLTFSKISSVSSQFVLTTPLHRSTTPTTTFSAKLNLNTQDHFATTFLTATPIAGKISAAWCNVYFIHKYIFQFFFI